MADYNAFGLIDRQELLDFTQNLTIERPYIGNVLFPDRKVQYINEEYERLIQNGTLPVLAEVHAFDTEATIAERLTWEKVQTEQLLIKKKINQTEVLRKKQRQLNDSEIKSFVFDDAMRLFNGVLARVEKAKIDALSLGKYPIKENNLDITIDYGIPAENFVKSWWDEKADILGDIVKWSDQADDQGSTPTLAITSRKVFRIIQRNEGIQKAISGAVNVGILPTIAQINALLESQAQIIIAIANEEYGVPEYEGTKLTMKKQKFFPDDTFVMVAADNPQVDVRGRLTSGTIGEGLWGVTPEEEAISGTFQMISERQFVTIDQWSTPDPVNVWTKASGLFVPVLPDVYGHIIANVADEASKPKGVLQVAELPLSVENGGTGAATADNARTNLDVYSKSEVDGKVAG